MKLYNIIFSPTGGVKKVTDIILNELSKDIITIDLTKNGEDFSNFKIEKEDVAIISMPSFGGSAPKIAIDRLKRIKSNNANAVLICVYGNRAYEDTLVDMKDAALDIGFKVIAAISAVAQHSIAKMYGENRPDNLDKEQLKEFSLKIKEQILNPKDSPLEIPRNKPCKKPQNVSLNPKTTNDCINCKKCADFCPTGAILKENVKKVDKNKCISCMRCVSICPKKAKKISKIMNILIVFALKKVCSKRKENELFLP